MSESSDPKQLNLLDPFLKWPGGKRWLAPRIARIIRGELTGTYYEPFVGAGAAFLAVTPKQSVLSDINAELIHCLQTVQKHAESVVRAIWRYSNTSDCYYRIRRMKPRTPISAAARFIFLDKACWGGVYRLNKKGEFNVPFGNSGRVLCRRDPVVKAAEALKHADIRCCDFEAAMGDARKGDVIYADPPYTSLGENNGFIRYNEHLFAWKDQERLALAAASARRRGVFVIVSGMWHTDLLSLYQGWWAYRLYRRSLVGHDLESRRTISEVLLFSRKPRTLIDNQTLVRIARNPQN